MTTRHDRVAGLGNSEGSQRALNMLFALRTIQQRTGKDALEVRHVVLAGLDLVEQLFQSGLKVHLTLLHAQVLYPGKEDFTPERRVEIFHQMKNNDWDAIILSHEQFAWSSSFSLASRFILRFSMPLICALLTSAPCW